MKNELENIDKVFKETFDGFEAEVDPSVWTNVQSAIGSGAATTTVTAVAGKSIALKIVAGVIALGAVATATYFISANLPKENDNVAEIAPVVTELEEVIPTEKVDETVLDVSEKQDETLVTETQEIVVEQTEQTNKTLNAEPANLPLESTEDEVSEITTNNVVAVATQPTKKEGAAENPVQKNEKEVEPELVEPEQKVNSEKVVEATPVEETSEEVVDSKSAKIHKDKIPRVISPNGDGIGDVIRIEGENVTSFEASVCNLNGTQIFKWNTIDGFWDGRDMSGVKVAKGTYMLVVIVHGADGKPDVAKQSITVF